MSGDLVAVGVIAIGLVATGLLVISARDVVRGILALIAHFLLTALLYAGLHAPLVAVAQIAVYAGAVMVLFLFVVMLMGAAPASEASGRSRQERWAIPLALLLALAVVGAILGSLTNVAASALPTLPEEFGSAVQVGMELMQRHLLAFELTGLLLLVAILGAVHLGSAPDADGADEAGRAE